VIADFWEMEQAAPLVCSIGFFLLTHDFVATQAARIAQSHAGFHAME
jgi:hypothetical protein